MDFRGSNFSAESGIHCWQSHRLLLRTPLKQKLKPQNQPLEHFFKKRRYEKFCKFHRKAPVLKSLFNRVKGRPAALLKKDSNTDVLLGNLQNF